MSIYRVHWIKTVKVTPTTVVTHCGREGWQENKTEFSSIDGQRFEAHKTLLGVTCKRCLEINNRLERARRIEQ